MNNQVSRSAFPLWKGATSYILILSAGIMLVDSSCRQGASTSKAGNSETSTPVDVIMVTKRPISKTLRFDADLRGTSEVNVYSQVAERILALPVEEGDVVKRGQVLAVLQAANLAAGVQSAAAATDAARADRDLLNAELQRAAKLSQKKIVAQAQVDQLRARLAAAEAQIRRLEAVTSQAATARGYATIRAPIDGVVGRKFLDSGDMATPQMPILTIVQSAKVEAFLAVPEQDLEFIRVGSEVRISVARYPHKVFDGRVAVVGPLLDRMTRSARVKVIVDNKDGRLMPGMLAHVEVVVDSRPSATVVPLKALIIQSDEEGKVTYQAVVVKGAAAAIHRLHLGIIEGDYAEVLDGLSVGEELVVRGQHLVKSGGRVNVVTRLKSELSSSEPVEAPR